MLKVFLAIICIVGTIVLWRVHWLLGYMGLAASALLLLQQIVKRKKWKRYLFLLWAIGVLTLFSSTGLHTAIVRDQQLLSLIEDRRVLNLLLGSPTKLVIASILTGIAISSVLVFLFVQAVIFVAGQLFLDLSQDAGLDRARIQRYLWSLFLRTNGPSIIVQEGRILQEGDPGWLHRLGGPGLLIVRAGNAVVLATAKGEERVLGAGTFRLRTFEKVHEVVDLRPQEENVSLGRVLTRDRIPLAFELGITFQIEHKADTESRLETYLDGSRSVQLVEGNHDVYEDVILRAVHNSAGNNWREQTINQAGTAVRDVVSDYGFQDLLYDFESQVATFDPDSSDSANQPNATSDNRDQGKDSEAQEGESDSSADFVAKIAKRSVREAAKASKGTSGELVALGELERRIQSRLMEHTVEWGVTIHKVDIVNMHIPAKLLDAALTVWEKRLEGRSLEQDALKQDAERITKVKWLGDILEALYQYDKDLQIEEVVEFLIPFFAPESTVQYQQLLRDQRQNQKGRDEPRQSNHDQAAE